MIGTLNSQASQPNELLVASPRQRNEDNLKWLGRALAGTREGCHILLLGGVTPTSFRLRLAQARMRHDLSPSHWSHVALLAAPGDVPAAKLAALPIFEISLEPVAGFGFPPPNNAIQQAALGQYRSARDYPNIAL